MKCNHYFSLHPSFPQRIKSEQVSRHCRQHRRAADLRMHLVNILNTGQNPSKNNTWKDVVWDHRCTFLRCFTTLIPDENGPDMIEEEMFPSELYCLSLTHVMFVTSFLARWMEAPSQTSERNMM